MQHSFLVPSNNLILNARMSTPDRYSESDPTIVLLGGFLADQLSGDPTARSTVIQEACDQAALRLVRFNYMAHGEPGITQSEGLLQDVTITNLIQNSVDVCTSIGTSKIALIASSIGAGITPFVAKELHQNGIDVAGILSIAALPPTFLRAFILSNLTDEQTERFEVGETVELNSPTLPVLVPVRAQQFEDLGAFQDYPEIKQTWAPDQIRLLYGSRDPASNEQTNLYLAGAFGAGTDSIYRLDGNHAVPFPPMLEHFKIWAEGFKK